MKTTIADDPISFMRKNLREMAVGFVHGIPVVETQYLPVDDDPWKCIPASPWSDSYIVIPKGYFDELKPLMEVALRPKPKEGA